MKQLNKRKWRIVGLFVAIVLSVLVAANMSAFAIVAYPELRPFEQPDGDTIQVVVKGDEYLNWTEDADGNLIVYDKAMEGYCFAIWGNRGVMSTGVYVTAGGPVGPGGVDGMESPGGVDGPDGSGGTVGTSSLAQLEKGGDIPQWILEDAERARSESTRSALQSSAGLQGFAAQAEIDSPSPRVSDLADLHRKTLIIHATWEDRSGFGDVKKLTGREIYNSVFNPGYRSANSYYKELIGVSGDALSPAHVNEPMDDQQGVIEIVLEGKHTDPDRNSDGDPLSFLNTRRNLMRRIINEASRSGLVDFSRFDENGNGIIESTELVVGIFVDGFDRSVGDNRGRPSVWAGADFDIIELINMDNKKLSGYFFMGSFYEIDNQNFPMGIGTICHEYGHIAYGFDDVYDYGSLIGRGMQSRMGYWSLMDQGAYGRVSDTEPIGSSPSYVDAYNLVRHGIVTPGVLVSGESVTVAAHNQIYIAKSEVSDSQYFLVQQRKYGSTSNYDRGSFYSPIYFGTNLSAIGGILIYQIDENVKNDRINDKPTHMRASIVEAHGQTQHLRQIRNPTPWDIPNLGDREDLWGERYRLFNHTSDPSSNFYGPFTYDLEPPPQNISSGISLSGITWNSSTGRTTFTRNTSVRFFWNRIPGDDLLYEPGNVANQGKMPDDKLTSPEPPVREGFIFLGWFTDRTGSRQWNFSVDTLESQNVDLYAQWVPKVGIIVTFDKNTPTTPDPDVDGPEPFTSKFVVYDGEYGTLASITRHGYDFSGWYLTPECDDDDLITEVSIVRVEVDHTLYARWNPQQTSSVSISVSSATGGADGEVTLSVTLVNNPGISAFRLTMKYDERLTFVSAARGDILTQNFSAYNDAAIKEVGVSATSGGLGDVLAGSLLYTITFKINEGVEDGIIELELGYFDEFDDFVSNYGLFHFDIVQQGSIIVRNVLYGDVNGDGVINSLDVTRLLEYFSGYDRSDNNFNMANADVNGDGVLNSLDVTRLLEYFSGYDRTPLGP